MDKLEQKTARAIVRTKSSSFAGFWSENASRRSLFVFSGESFAYFEAGTSPRWEKVVDKPEGEFEINISLREIEKEYCFNSINHRNLPDFTKNPKNVWISANSLWVTKWTSRTSIKAFRSFPAFAARFTDSLDGCPVLVPHSLSGESDVWSFRKHLIRSSRSTHNNQDRRRSELAIIDGGVFAETIIHALWDSSSAVNSSFSEGYQIQA